MDPINTVHPIIWVLGPYSLVKSAIFPTNKRMQDGKLSISAFQQKVYICDAIFHFDAVFENLRFGCGQCS
jgi:hypothetical protein